MNPSYLHCSAFTGIFDLDQSVLTLMPPSNSQPAGYIQLLDKLKREIRTTQLRATFAANAELLALYWRIGTIILEQEKLQGWGRK